MTTERQNAIKLAALAEVKAIKGLSSVRPANDRCFVWGSRRFPVQSRLEEAESHSATNIFTGHDRFPQMIAQCRMDIFYNFERTIAHRGAARRQ